MDMLADTQALFEQLAHVGPRSVKTLIETHDAALHSGDVEQALATLAARRAVVSDPLTTARMAQQRRQLSSLVTLLPTRYSNAI